MLRTFAALTVVGVLGVPAAATAQVDALPTVYGGGIVAERAYLGGPAAGPPSTAIGLRRLSASRVAIRLTVVVACKAYSDGTLRGTDFRLQAPMTTDGSIEITKSLRDRELGSTTVTVTGKLLGDHAEGAATVQSSLGCGRGERRWFARPVDPAHPPAAGAAAPAPVEGVLYGATTQALSTYPHGFVARVTAGGTVAHAFTSYDERCRERVRGRPRTETVTLQTILAERPIAAGVWSWDRTRTETAKERRRGIDYAFRNRWRGTFAGAALAGTLSLSDRYREPRYSERCATGSVGFVAVP